MGMTNPHNPEETLWNAYSAHMDIFVVDPHNSSAKDTADYYLDQWFKQTEKRVKAEIASHRIKETAGDKLPKIKPKSDKLKS